MVMVRGRGTGTENRPRPLLLPVRHPQQRWRSASFDFPAILTVNSIGLCVCLAFGGGAQTISDQILGKAEDGIEDGVLRRIRGGRSGARETGEEAVVERQHFS
jgi:hypothetical protein